VKKVNPCIVANFTGQAGDYYHRHDKVAY
jgi:hypothetical protein